MYLQFCFNSKTYSMRSLRLNFPKSIVTESTATGSKTGSPICVSPCVKISLKHSEAERMISCKTKGPKNSQSLIFLIFLIENTCWLVQCKALKAKKIQQATCYNGFALIVMTSGRFHFFICNVMVCQVGEIRKLIRRKRS